MSVGERPQAEAKARRYKNLNQGHVGRGGEGETERHLNLSDKAKEMPTKF
jgi:hypothetical protein